MKTKVRLFLNDQELEFTGQPSVLYNFNLDSVANPTAVKNQYTKTVQVEGTPKNNKIFGEIWDLTRIQADGNFNPSKRTPFELYIDGELYETGYVKLNSISRTHNKIVYNITLYGGIGDFLYNLTYRSDGEQLMLKDLHYISNSDPTSELDFKINWDTVRNAWWHLQVPYYSDARWDVINFAPCYNGYPEDFDCDKVLINTVDFTGETRVRESGSTTTSTGFPTAITADNQTYQTKDGYAYGEINGKMTEWEIRDLRSYLQRPVLRMKKVIEACCDPAQNGGYEVELDEDFFNTGNTYYENAWMTLPMLNELKYDGETVDTFNGHIDYRITYNGTWNQQWRIAEDSTRGSNVNAIEIVFRPKVYINYSYNSPEGRLYCAANVSQNDPQWNATAWVYQLFGYDYNDEIACGSDIYVLTSSANGRYLNIQSEAIYVPAWSNGSIYNRLGYWDYVGNETINGTNYRIYEWPEDISLKMSTTGVKVKTLWMKCNVVANLTYGTSFRGEEYRTYGYRQGRLYSSTTLTTLQDRVNYWPAYSYSYWPDGLSGNIYYGAGSSINSNAVVTKQTLLSIQGSPCQYLVGFLKTFGLYLRKDPLQKKMYILTRPNYYKDETENWEDRIDHTKQITVSPLTFKKKWYSFNFTQKDKSATETKYYDKYGTNYGTEKVNTGYNFDSETEDLLKGIVYNNAADCLEKSAYFVDRYYNGQNNYPTFLYSWINYQLMQSDSDDTHSVQLGSTFNYTDVSYSQYGEMYDQIPKVQLRNSNKGTLEGTGILLFYNGTKPCINASGQTVEFHLSDDVSEMFEFGDQPCWLYTQGLYNKAGQQIVWYFSSLPQFTRCTYDSDYVIKSWDFGKVKELYTPNTYYADEANIYDKWWKLYVNDLYDINTRVVEAFVKLPKTQGDTLMRKFYWFDNSLWRINKISDWDVCSEDTTKVEFIKVQNKNNYLYYSESELPEDLWVSDVDMAPVMAPASGGVVTFTCTSNMPWGSNGPDYDWVDFDPSYWSGGHPSGVTYITATLEANTSTTPRSFIFDMVNSQDEHRAYLFTQNGASS